MQVFFYKLISVIIKTFSQFFEIFGFVFVIAIIMWHVNQHLRGMGEKLFSDRYYYIVSPGIIIHEIGHALGCILTGTKIHKFVPFCPQKDGTLGKVEYIAKKGIIFNISKFFISTGPVWFGCIIILTIANFLVGDDFVEDFLSISPRLGDLLKEYIEALFWGVTIMIKKVFFTKSWFSIRFIVSAYLIYCIGTEITLSKIDIKHMRGGILSIIFVLLILNLIPFFSEYLDFGVWLIVPYVFIFQILLLFVLLINTIILLFYYFIYKVIRQRFVK